MITIDQALRGASKYADNEIIPHLPTGKGIAAGIALALILDSGKSQIMQLREHPAVQMMGVIDEAGNIDLDRLYNAARVRVDGKKIPLTIPILGELRFDVNDVDKLYHYMQEV